MKKSIKKISAMMMAAAVAAGVLLTGCSGGSDSSPTTTAAASGGSDTAPTTAGNGSSAADSGNTVSSDGISADVQKIIDARKMKVGCKVDVPNFGLQNTATGEFEGVEVDLAYEIAGKIFGCTAEEAKEQGLIEFQGVNAKTRGPLLDNGELDMVIATYTITPERKETWNFSTPYYTDAVGLLVLKESGINSMADVDGKVIGVAQGSTTKEVTLQYIEEQGLNVTPVFEEFDGYPALAAALAAKNIDVFSVDRAILSGYNDDTTQILDDRFAEQDYGVATKLENKGLAELVEGVVTELKDSGKMAEMLKGWGIE